MNEPTPTQADSPAQSEPDTNMVSPELEPVSTLASDGALPVAEFAPAADDTATAASTDAAAGAEGAANVDRLIPVLASEPDQAPAPVPDGGVPLPEPALVPIAAAAEPDQPDAATGQSAVHEPAVMAEAAPEAEAEPRTTFADLGLSEAIVQAVSEKGYLHPTPIQAQAIPTVLMGRDVLGVAQTGTGKTASFVLPMMDILSGSRARARMPRSLILEPTRELALQVAENFVSYGKHLKLNHALLIGGESMSEQKDVLAKGVDVLIATPGRLIDLFERGGLLMTDARLLVIDEADRMLDMGFIPDVERIVAMLPRNRQTLFFSATMAPEIKRLSDAFLQNPKLITVSRPASVATTIVAGLALVGDTDKREALRRLIRSEEVQNAMIFCNRKIEVDVLYKSLKRHGFDVGALHGDMSQTERTATMARFKANELRLLVCSDVAARGVDISGMSHVFNFDVPHHAEDYVHRIGRTGRAGMIGHAFTLAVPDDKLAVDAIEALIGAPIPRLAVAGLDVVTWAEGDGRKRRGRGRTAAAKPEPRTPRAKAERPAAAAGEPEARPRRTRAPRGQATAPAAEPVALPVQDEALHPADSAGPARQEVEATPRQERDATPRQERDATPRQERDATSRQERDASPRREREDRSRRDRVARGPREERPREDRARGRGRDEDGGPAVQGFGDDVPAFMLIRSPLRAASPRQTEETAS